MKLLLSVALLFACTSSVAQERDFESYLDGLVAAQFKDYKLAILMLWPTLSSRVRPNHFGSIAVAKDKIQAMMNNASRID